MKRKITIVGLVLTFVLAIIAAPSFGWAHGDVGVKVYLVVPTGVTVNGTAGADVPALHLENAVEHVGAAGTALPTPSTRDGFTFRGWVTHQNALTKFVTVVPSTGAIYYARFERTDSDILADKPIDVSAELSHAPHGSLYIAINGNKNFDQALRSRWQWVQQLDNGKGNTEYMFFDIELKVGDKVMFYSPAPMFGSVGSHSTYPHEGSGKADGIGYSLKTESTYGNLKVGDSDTMAVGGDGNKYPNVPKDGTTTPLEVKVAGTYNFYAVLWNNGGWVELYAAKAS